jgi:hypothetical protein
MQSFYATDIIEELLYYLIQNRWRRRRPRGLSAPPTPTESTHLEAQPTSKPASLTPATTSLNFASVSRAFVSMMESYRKFTPLTLRLAPYLYSAFASRKMEDFVNSKGKKCLSLSTETSTVCESDVSCYPEFSVYNDEIIAMKEGARLLPELMVIGLVSSYDAFLSQLLRVVLNMHPEIVLTSDKTIKFSELSTFASIEEAGATLIDREIEAAIRLSHHEQFSWMEHRFSMPLRKDLPIWPRFIELCERRNLLTHTGGIVSAQYLANCKAHKCDVTGIQVGSKLAVNSRYFADSVSIIYEIGTKLCHVFWRKFAEAERAEADESLNDLCYGLIYGRSYRLAESLLYFGTRILKEHASDSGRRTMIVNLANCIRLQNREDEAKQFLDKEDWSAVDNNFHICVASVYGDIEKVLQLMPIIGAKGKPTTEDYRTWPVFSGIRTDGRFLTTFEEIFGEPLITSGAVKVEQTSDVQSADVELADDGLSKRTIH